MFLYCFDNETREKLLLNGYTFMKEIEFNNKQGFMFMNNGNKINFNKSEVLFSNRMNF